MKVPVSLCLLLFLSLPCEAKEANWQGSISVSTNLEIRDKEGDLGAFEALFKVKGAGQTFQKKISVEEGGWGSVKFPDDFGGYVPSDNYQWQCIVKGKIVLTGTIDYRIQDDGGIKLSASTVHFGPPKPAIRRMNKGR